MINPKVLRVNLPVKLPLEICQLISRFVITETRRELRNLALDAMIVRAEEARQLKIKARQEIVQLIYTKLKEAATNPSLKATIVVNDATAKTAGMSRSNIHKMISIYGYPTKETNGYLAAITYEVTLDI